MTMTSASEEVRAEAKKRQGHAVRVALAIKGYKPKDVAEWLGISAGQVSQRLKGKVAFRGDELAVLAYELDEEPAYFFRLLSTLDADGTTQQYLSDMSDLDGCDQVVLEPAA